MEKYYEVVFYGEIHDGKDLGQVKQLLAKVVGKNESDIGCLFSGNKASLKKCPSYDHAKKYADLFEKIGAKVEIEQIGSDKSIESGRVSSDKTNKVLSSFTTRFLKNPRPLLTGIVLIIMGVGIGFWIASQYFSYQNLSIIAPIKAQQPVTSVQKQDSSQLFTPLAAAGARGGGRRAGRR